MSHLAQRAMANGLRRAIDKCTIPAGEVDLTHAPRAYCMTQSEADAAVARRRAEMEREAIMQGQSPEAEAPRRRSEPNAIDHYEQGNLLTERQIHAARRLARLYHAGRPRIGNLTAQFSDAPKGKGEMTDYQAECWAEYCQSLKAVPPQCSQAVARVVAGEFPLMANGLGYLREGLDAVLAYWARQAKKMLDTRVGRN